MPTEMWSSYPPEVNSSRWEMGTGPASWAAAAAVWTNFAGLVATSATSLAGEIAVMTGATVTGSTSVAMLSSSVPFLGWLGAMGGVALVNAAACATVAQAWGTATAGIIPAPVVTQNRITEGIAEATNFLGINTPLITELNREYGQFWVQDAVSMMTYDEAVSLATLPKPAPPPPTLPGSSVLGSAVDSATEMAVQTAMETPQQLAQQAMEGAQELNQGAAGSAQNASQMVSQMAGMAGQLPQMAMQPFQQFMQQGQQLPQMFQQLLGQFMSGPQMGGDLGSSFALGDMAALNGGVPLLTGAGAVGGLGAGSGGGAPLNMSLPSGGGGGGGAINTALGSGAGIGSGITPMGTASNSGGTTRAAVNLSGVPAPTMGSGNASTMGSGMAPVGGMGGAGAAGAGGSGGGARRSEIILAADVGNNDYVDTRQERKLFS
jgi:PPE-repeat protein